MKLASVKLFDDDDDVFLLSFILYEKTPHKRIYLNERNSPDRDGPSLLIAMVSCLNHWYRIFYVRVVP